MTAKPAESKIISIVIASKASLNHSFEMRGEILRDFIAENFQKKQIAIGILQHKICAK